MVELEVSFTVRPGDVFYTLTVAGNCSHKPSVLILIFELLKIEMYYHDTLNRN